MPRLELTHLNFDMPDIHGFVPDPVMFGNVLTHTARGDQYIITGYSWLGATDEWGFEHRMIGDMGPTITRPLSDLPGRRHEGTHRYEEAGDYQQYFLG